jgi:hypothetical protein
MHGDPTLVFKKYGVPIGDCELMLKELEQFEAEVLSKIKGTWMLTPEVRDEQGNITSPATYFDATGRVMLLASITTAYVPKDLAMNELIACYPVYLASRTYNAFVIAVRS